MHAGRLHPHQHHGVFCEPPAQLGQRRLGGGEGVGLLVAPATLPRRCAYRRYHRVALHIQPGAPLRNNVHGYLLRIDSFGSCDPEGPSD
jgi:hypothetical protein